MNEIKWKLEMLNSVEAEPNKAFIPTGLNRVELHQHQSIVRRLALLEDEGLITKVQWGTGIHGLIDRAQVTRGLTIEGEKFVERPYLLHLLAPHSTLLLLLGGVSALVLTFLSFLL